MDDRAGELAAVRAGRVLEVVGEVVGDLVGGRVELQPAVRAVRRPEPVDGLLVHRLGEVAYGGAVELAGRTEPGHVDHVKEVA